PDPFLPVDDLYKKFLLIRVSDLEVEGQFPLSNFLELQVQKLWHRFSPGVGSQRTGLQFQHPPPGPGRQAGIRVLDNKARKPSCCKDCCQCEEEKSVPVHSLILY